MAHPVERPPADPLPDLWAQMDLAIQEAARMDMGMEELAQALADPYAQIWPSAAEVVDGDGWPEWDGDVDEYHHAMDMFLYSAGRGHGVAQGHACAVGRGGGRAVGSGVARGCGRAVIDGRGHFRGGRSGRPQLVIR